MGLFKKDPRDKKVKELVGGFIPSDSLRERLVSKGINPDDNNFDIKVQSAFKNKVKTDDISIDELELFLDNIIDELYTKKQEKIKMNNETDLNDNFVSRKDIINNLVGGFLPSNVLKSKIVAYGVDPKENNLAINIQSAFKRRIKEENIPTEELESYLDKLIDEAIKRPEILDFNYIKNYNSNFLKSYETHNLIDINNFKKWYNNKQLDFNKNKINEDLIKEYLNDINDIEVESNENYKLDVDNTGNDSFSENVENNEFIEEVDSVDDSMINVEEDCLIDEEVDSVDDSMINVEEDCLIDEEVDINALSIDELKDYKKLIKDNYNKKKEVEARIEFLKTLEKTNLEESEVLYLKKVSIRETRTNHNLRDRDEELISGIVALLENKLIIQKLSVFRKKDRGVQSVLYKNISNVDYDKGGIFSSDSIEISLSGTERIIITYVDLEELYHKLDEKVNEAHLDNSQKTTVIQEKNSVAEDLEKIAQLYEKGLLSDDEFKEMKRKIIDSL